jgi:hypothetical protein
MRKWVRGRISDVEINYGTEPLLVLAVAATLYGNYLADATIAE